MIKVTELTITTEIVEINIENKSFITSLRAKKEEAIERYGEYKVINSFIYQDKTFLLIKED